MTRFAATAALVAASALVLCTAVSAQILATRLEGVVQNSSGAPVPDATITATNDKNGWQTTTTGDTNGRFVFPALPPGSYTVTVQAKGFRPSAHLNVLLGMAGSTEERYIMGPQGPKEPSREEAPFYRLSKSESQVSGAFAPRDLEVLPQLDRTPLLLSALQRGVLINGGTPGSSSVNGTSLGSNNVTLDGMDVNDPVSPTLGLSTTANNTDSIAQFRVVTDLGQAEYGRNAGAQVMLVTRSGGSRWSGNAFDYFRTQGLNANDWFNNATGVSRPRFTQNLYGGSLGGPLVTDRTFLFGNYEGRHTTQDVTRNRTVLTSSAKAGLFQWVPPGGIATNSFNIVANDPRKLGINPSVASALKQLPDFNNVLIGDGLNTAGYQFNSPANSDADQVTVRVDHQLKENHRLFLRFSWARSSGIDALSGADATFPGLPAGTNDERHWGGSLGSEWSLSPQMVNELRLGYQSANIVLNRPARIAGPMLIFNTFTTPEDPSFPRSHNAPVVGIKDNLTTIRGKHALKAGFNINYTSQKSSDLAGIYPNVTFGTGFGNALPNSIGPSGSTLISPADRQKFSNFYNDLLGRMEQVSQTYYSTLTSFLPSGTPRARNFRFMDYGVFLQDDWKYKPNLTLNLGIRFEVSGAPTETNGIQGTINQASGIGAGTNIANFSFQPGAQLYSTDLKDFAPRAGFSWAPRNSTKTLIHGGFGMFYDRLVGATTNFVDSNTQGSSQGVSVYPNLGGGDIRLSNGIPLPSQPAAPGLTLPNSRSTSMALFTPGLRLPYVMHFNLMIERQIASNTIVEAGYVGERGRRLFTDVNFNQLKINGSFLQAFQELQAFRASGTPVSSTNTLVRMFGSVGAAISAVGGSVLDQGQAGLGADTIDRSYYSRYAAVGLSDFYLRNFPQYNQFVVGTNQGESYFDSVQVNARTKIGPLRWFINYTWGKSFDNVSPVCSGCTSVMDSFNPQLNRAPSDFDRKKILNSWAVWSLPLGKDRRVMTNAPPFLNFFVGNWDLGLIAVRETGPRFSVSSGLQTARAGIPSLADVTISRPTGAVSEENNGVFFFSTTDISTFRFPAAGSTGNTGRNSFVGPGYFNLDMSLTKSLRLRKERRLSFRIEVYNIFNHPSFGAPDANLSDTTFGQITSTQGYPRQLQLSLRYDF